MVARAGQRNSFLCEARPRRAFYIACLRIAAKPTRPKRTVSMIIAHPESVGAKDTGGTGGATVKVAMAGAALPPLSVCKALAANVLG